jgi:tRNA(fMet)-specific endonuclease VapC
VGQRLAESARSVDYVIDTTFLIRLWRERQRSAEYRFVTQHADESVCMPWVVKGEFLRGAVLAGHDEGEVRGFLDRYPTVWATDDTLVHYARIYKTLVKSGKTVGANDLWIAASAAEHDLPLLTRNASEFRRIAGLQVVDYASAD